MPNMVMSKTGERIPISKWNALSSEEKDVILKRSGPAYTEEAWNRNHNVKTRKVKSR